MTAAKILIVEDEKNARQALADFFYALGYHVESSASEMGAIQLGQAFQPALLISDWLLGDEGQGVAVASALHKLNPQLKIILFSGLPLSALKEACADLPVTCFLEKPLSLSTINSAVQQALAER